MIIDDNFYMQLAIDEAWKYQLQTYPNPAVGAVVVKNNELLSICAHQKAGGAHAEVLALKDAFIKKNQTSPLKVLQSSYEIHNFLVIITIIFFTIVIYILHLSLVTILVELQLVVIC